MVSAMKSAALFAPVYHETGVRRVAKLSRGLPAGVIPALATDLLLSINDLAQFLGLSPRTLRNRTGKLTPDEAQRSFRAFRVFRRAVEVLGEEQAARDWLKTPQRALGEKRPLDLIAIDLGAEEVLNLLGAIQEGSYL